MNTNPFALSVLPEVMGVPDLAARLHLSRNRIRTLLRDGRLPGRRVGRRWFVTRNALLHALTPDNARERLSIVGGQDNA